MGIKTEALIVVMIFTAGLIMFIWGVWGLVNHGISSPIGDIGFLTMITVGVVLLCRKLTVGSGKRTKVLVLAVALFLLLFPFIFGIIWYEILPWEGLPPDIFGLPIICWLALGIFLIVIWTLTKSSTKNIMEAKQ